MPTCPHCQLPQGGEAGCCRCGTPRLQVGEPRSRLIIEGAGPFQVPPVCICCGAPQDCTQPAKVVVDVGKVLLLELGWCSDCLHRKSRHGLLEVVLMAGMMGPLFAIPIWRFGVTALGSGLAVAGLVLGAVVGGKLAALLKPRLPGHCVGCDAGRSEFADVAPGGRPGGVLRGCHGRFIAAWHSLNGRQSSLPEEGP